MSRVDPNEAPDSWTWTHEENLPDPLAECPYCDRPPAHKKQITRHINVDHPDETPLNSTAWLHKKYVEQDLTMRQIAELVDMSKHTVRKKLNESGVSVQEHSGIPAEAAEKLENESYVRREYVQNERGAPQIADELGVCTDTVYRALENHGIERRSPAWYKTADGPHSF